MGKWRHHNHIIRGFLLDVGIQLFVVVVVVSLLPAVFFLASLSPSAG